MTSISKWAHGLTLTRELCAAEVAVGAMKTSFSQRTTSSEVWPPPVTGTKTRPPKRSYHSMWSRARTPCRRASPSTRRSHPSTVLRADTTDLQSTPESLDRSCRTAFTSLMPSNTSSTTRASSSRRKSAWHSLHRYGMAKKKVGRAAATSLSSSSSASMPLPLPLLLLLLLLLLPLLLLPLLLAGVRAKPIRAPANNACQQIPRSPPCASDR